MTNSMQVQMGEGNTGGQGLITESQPRETSNASPRPNSNAEFDSRSINNASRVEYYLDTTLIDRSAEDKGQKSEKQKSSSSQSSILAKKSSVCSTATNIASIAKIKNPIIDIAAESVFNSVPSSRLKPNWRNKGLIRDMAATAVEVALAIWHSGSTFENETLAAEALIDAVVDAMVRGIVSESANSTPGSKDGFSGAPSDVSAQNINLQNISSSKLLGNLTVDALLANSSRKVEDTPSDGQNNCGLNAVLKQLCQNYDSNEGENTLIQLLRRALNLDGTLSFDSLDNVNRLVALIDNPVLLIQIDDRRLVQNCQLVLKNKDSERPFEATFENNTDMSGNFTNFSKVYKNSPLFDSAGFLLRQEIGEKFPELNLQGSVRDVLEGILADRQSIVLVFSGNRTGGHFESASHSHQVLFPFESVRRKLTSRNGTS
jgi:hypothetical protein